MLIHSLSLRRLGVVALLMLCGCRDSPTLDALRINTDHAVAADAGADAVTPPSVVDSGMVPDVVQRLADAAYQSPADTFEPYADNGDAIFYVAVNGSDATGNGSITSPFASLQRAAAAIRQMKAEAGGQLTCDVQVRLRGGVYSLDETFVLTVANDPALGVNDSGSTKHSITYTAHHDGKRYEEVLISGGRVLDDVAWDEGGVTGPPTQRFRWWGYYALESAVRDLWLGGRRLIPAREPNAGWLPILDATGTNDPDAPTKRSFGVGALKNLHPKDTSVEVVAHVQWLSPRQQLTDLATQWDVQNGRIHLPVCERLGDFKCWNTPRGPGANDPDNARCGQPGYPGDRVYFERATAFMNQPYEWVQAMPSGQINILLPADDPTLPPAETDPQKGIVTAPTLTTLVRLEGTLDSKGHPIEAIRNVHFRHLSFAFTNQPLPTEVGQCPPGGPSGVKIPGFFATQSALHPTYGMRLAAAIELHAADNCSLQHSRVAHTGGNALSIWGNDNVVSGNEIFDTGAIAVYVGPHKPWTHQDAKRSGVKITNNYIHDYGVTFQEGAAIVTRYTDKAEVTHNEVANGAYTGISTGWGWSSKSCSNMHGSIISNNSVHHVMRELNDGAALYAPGRQDSAPDANGNCQVAKTSEMNNNVLSHISREPGVSPKVSGNAAIQFDAGTRGWSLSGNVLMLLDDVIIKFSKNKNDPVDPLCVTWSGVNYFDDAAAVGPYVEGACGGTEIPPEAVELFDSAQQLAPHIQTIVDQAGPELSSRAFLYETCDPLVHHRCP